MPALELDPEEPVGICITIPIGAPLENPTWILNTGFWDDNGIWIDTSVWND